MNHSDVDSLRTVGEIAELLSEPFWRVRYVLDANPAIKPVRCIRNYRVFDPAAVRQILKRLEDIHAKRPVTA